MALWRSTQYRDYAPFEGATGPAFHLARDGQRIERPVILEEHAQILQAARDFVGYPRVEIAPSGAKWISRVLPHPYPGLFGDLSSDNWGLPFIWCESLQRAEGMKVLGNDPSTGAPLYQHGLVRLIYSAPTYKVLSDGHSSMQFSPQSGQDNPLAGFPDEATLSRYVTRHPKPFFKTISIPRTLLRWVLRAGDTGHTGVDDAAAGPPLFESIGLPEAGVVREYTWHQIPLINVPETAIAQAMGRVNQFTFDGKYPPQTLLCEAPDIVPAPHLRGDVVVDVRYRFRQVVKISRDDQITSRGHNWFLRAVLRASGTSPILDYRLLTTTGLSTGKTVFPSYDFAKLFRPE